eukprot:gnl/Trimastix_PCT/3047.p1 GENE.gnl/Trimastix_PCT/3047~~gnl/Trimastix_PCT/3047.p1  ORF type:complete len:434 (-),score=107.27 gnl/Trimastix_PCT/3047:189-1490(-)
MLGARMEDFEDDPVVQEIDVYLNTSNENIWMLQYPLRPRYIPYDTKRLKEVRVRPVQAKMQMDFNLDLQSEFYDQDAELMEDDTDEGMRRPRQYTLGSHCVVQKNNYAVGLYSRGQLHLVPISNVLQLRPCFPEIDARVAEQRERQHKKAQESMENLLPTTQIEQQKGSAMHRFQMRFRRRPQGEAPAQHAPTYTYRMHQQREAMEPWRTYRWVGKQERAAREHLGSLFALTSERIPMQLDLRKHLEDLAPVNKAQPGAQEDLPRGQLAQLPLREQISILLRRSHALQFRTLVEWLGADPAEVLAEVPSVAVLVQGTWVEKTDPSKWKGHQSSCRDLLLYYYNRTRVVPRKQYQDATGLHPEIVERIFHEVAVPRLGLGWEFKLPRDEAFLTEYPEVALDQDRKWDEMGRTIIPYLRQQRERVLRQLQQSVLG